MAPPIVDLHDQTVLLNSTIAAAELFTGFDPNDEIVEYFFQDFRAGADTGYWLYDGVAQAQGSTVRVAAGDLDKLSYVGGSQVKFEGFKVIARDEVGQFSSPAVRGTIYTVRANTTQPHVLVPRVNLLGNEVMSGSEFIWGYDPDGHPISQFQVTEGTKLISAVASNGVLTVTGYEHNFSDGDTVTLTGANEAAYNVTGEIELISPHVFRINAAGVPDGTATGNMLAYDDDDSYFEFNGERIAPGVPTIIPADQVDDLKFFSFGDDDIKNFYLSGYDGADWSFDKKGFVRTFVNANEPVVQTTRAATPASQPFFFGSHINVVDVDGSTMKKYQFYNTSPHGELGDLYKGTVQFPRQQWFEVDADELDTVSYRTEFVGQTQQIRVRAFDGERWSAPGTLVIESGAPIIRADIAATTGVVVLDQLEEIDLGGLYVKVDIGNPHEMVQIYEPTTDPRSGNLKFNDLNLAGGEIHTFTEAQFQSGVKFKSGEFLIRNIDPVFVRKANDNGQWSDWEKIEFRTEPEFENALTSGTSWNGILPIDSQGRTQITYSFMQSFPDYETGEANDDDVPEHFSIFSDGQRESTRRVFRQLEEFANVKFVEIADSGFNSLGQRGGIMRFGNYGRPIPDESTAAAFAFFPSFAAPGGDQWFNRFAWDPAGLAEPDFTYGSWGYKVLMHELGHAMGLKHPHSGVPRLTPTVDDNSFTVMSYVQAPNGEPTTFQLYDVAELQDLYGANYNTRTGNDTYSIWAFFDNRQAFVETIWDGGGNDTLSANGSPRDSVVDIRMGQKSTIGSWDNNVTIAMNTVIENAIGSAHDDQLFGNGGDNTLMGMDGDDTLYGNHGDDYVRGGAGDDTYVWGIGDGNDIIDEQGLAGRDTLRIDDFPALATLEFDMVFGRNGDDVYAYLALDNGPVENNVRINNQFLGGYRIETLELNGVRIDFANLTSQLSDGGLHDQRFRVLADSTAFGQLVAPV